MIDKIIKLLLIVILTLIIYNIWVLHTKLYNIKEWINIFTHVMFPSN